MFPWAPFRSTKAAGCSICGGVDPYLHPHLRRQDARRWTCCLSRPAPSTSWIGGTWTLSGSMSPASRSTGADHARASRFRLVRRQLRRRPSVTATDPMRRARLRHEFNYRRYFSVGRDRPCLRPVPSARRETHRFVGTKLEPYVAVAIVAGIALSFLPDPLGHHWKITSGKSGIDAGRCDNGDWRHLSRSHRDGRNSLVSPAQIGHHVVDDPDEVAAGRCRRRTAR
jgi:hypothetical protein